MLCTRGHHGDRRPISCAPAAAGASLLSLRCWSLSAERPTITTDYHDRLSIVTRDSLVPVVADEGLVLAARAAPLLPSRTGGCAGYRLSADGAMPSGAAAELATWLLLTRRASSVLACHGAHDRESLRSVSPGVCVSGSAVRLVRGGTGSWPCGLDLAGLTRILESGSTRGGSESWDRPMDIHGVRGPGRGLSADSTRRTLWHTHCGTQLEGGPLVTWLRGARHSHKAQ